MKKALKILILEDDKDLNYSIREELISLANELKVQIIIYSMLNLGEIVIDKNAPEKFNENKHLDCDIAILDLKVPGGSVKIPPEYDVYGGAYLIKLLHEKGICKHNFVQSAFLKDKTLPPEVKETLELIEKKKQLISWDSKASSGLAKENLLSYIKQVVTANAIDYFLPLSGVSSLLFASKTNYPVLLLGPTGSGKEYFAKKIHDKWQEENNTNGDFVVVNCAMANPQLLQDDLCGHVKGAYTGADNHKLGKALLASGLKSKIRKTRESNRELKNKVENLQNGLNAFINRFDKIYEKKIDRQEFDKMMNEVYNSIATNIIDDIASISKQFETIKSRINTNQSEDYANWLTGCNDGLISRYLDSFDLVIDYNNENNKKNFGTLFLDEIGDMPLESQSMILRLLSNEPEISPLGYEGRITGVKMRIIAATSNPTWIEYAGGAINKFNKANLNYREPRPDLFHRLAYHVIEVGELTSDELNNFIDFDMWEDEALQILIEAIEGGKLTGHRRELRKIAVMINDLMKCSESLGITNKKRVTNEVLYSVWKPSLIDTKSIESDKLLNIDEESKQYNQKLKKIWLIDDFVRNGSVNKNTIEQYILNYLLMNLDQSVSAEEAIKYINLQNLKGKEKLTKRNFEATVSRLRKKLKDLQKESNLFLSKRGYMISRLL